MRQPKPSAASLVEEDEAPPIPFEGRLGISINETCTALGLRRDKVYELIAKGGPEGLTASQIGRRTVVHVASIKRLLAATVLKLKPRVRRKRPPPSARRERTEAALAAAGTEDRHVR
jgi:hypothetical protein